MTDHYTRYLEDRNRRLHAENQALRKALSQFRAQLAAIRLVTAIDRALRRRIEAQRRDTP